MQKANKLTILLLTVCLPATALCQRMDLYTDCYWGQSECPQTAIHPCLAGACAFIYTGIDGISDQDMSRNNTNSDWPEGLTINVGVYENGSWNELPDFAKSISIKRWERETLKSLNKQSDTKSLSWEFQFIVPENMVGKTLWFQAEYQTIDNRIFRTELIPDGRTLVSVVEPCSEKDLQRVAGTFVQAARYEGDWGHAIEIADSLISSGWSDFYGLVAAAASAFRTQKWEKQLQYFDLNFSVNGRCDPFSLEWSDEEAAIDYSKKRQEILDIIEEQQR